VIVAAVMFRLALPVLVSVTFCEALLPTFTLLKLRDDGLMLSCACVAAPVPLKLTTRGEPGALLDTEMLPVAFPLLCGANVTVKETDPFGASVCAARLLMLNPVPLALAAVIFRFAVPEFVSVTLTDALFPIRMLPKLMLDGLAVIAA
jgi:hypothetical protein